MRSGFVPYANAGQIPVMNPQQQQQQMQARQQPLLQVSNYPSAVKDMVLSIQELYRPETREKAILELSKNRDHYPLLGPALWYSVGIMPIMLQEIVSMYPVLSMPGQVSEKSVLNRPSCVLTLLSTVAHHEASRKPFLDSQICLFLYPFLRVSPNEKTEVLCLTSLGVIGALVKSEDPAVITYLLNTEIFPLCLRIMEHGTEISQMISTFIVQKLLLSDQGLNYACQTPNRFTAVAEVLQHMVSKKNSEGEHVCSCRLLRHIIRCYLRLSENERAREALSNMLPEALRNNTFHLYLEKDGSIKKWMLQLLVNIGDEGAKRINVTEKKN